jgi:hypothetical protein
MAWFRNHYECARCGSRWTDEWSCMCDDDCQACGARHMSPMKSDDLTEIIFPRDGSFVLLQSPATAEHVPGYVEVRQFASLGEAEAYLTAEAH